MEDKEMIDLTAYDEPLRFTVTEPDLNAVPQALDLVSSFVPAKEVQTKITDLMLDTRTRFFDDTPFGAYVPFDNENYWRTHRGQDGKFIVPEEVDDYKINAGLTIEDLVEEDKKEVEAEVKKRKESEKSETKAKKRKESEEAEANFNKKYSLKKMKLEPNELKLGELVMIRNYLNRKFFGDYIETEPIKRQYSWVQVRCSCCGFILEVIPFPPLIGRKHDIFTIYTKGRCVSCVASNGVADEDVREVERRQGKRFFRALIAIHGKKGKGERIYVVKH